MLPVCAEAAWECADARAETQGVVRSGNVPLAALTRTKSVGDRVEIVDV
jgi:hypothetical protein